MPYADTSWKHFSQSLLSSKWFEHPSLLQGKGLVKVLFQFNHFSLCLIKNTWQALDMQLVLHDHLFIVIFNRLVGYGLQLKKRRCGPSHHTLMYRLLLIVLSLCCLLRGSLGDPPEIEVDQHLWIPINLGPSNFVCHDCLYAGRWHVGALSESSDNVPRPGMVPTSWCSSGVPPLGCSYQWLEEPLSPSFTGRWLSVKLEVLDHLQYRSLSLVKTWTQLSSFLCLSPW